ncbi:hypothetical protein N665_0346s0012 [Sinapis alba]|nr:hypothetical protein N665_0346s0012 [Sinapis alba]
MVESTSGNELLSFMDAFSGYNQIMMHPDDREKMSFITDRGTYCYRVMPFGLKNAGATYQRLVNRMFADKLGITMEVYIDDMLVKSLVAKDHIRHLSECFETLNKYIMKVNPAKCTFRVTSGEFLEYIVTQRGIEANPKQISAVLDLPDLKTAREIQHLTGRVAALNRFISRSMDKCLPFYELLRGNKRFLWDEACEKAFTALKRYLTTPPVLAKPDACDTLYLYIANANQSGRLSKWAIELSEYDISYKSRPTIKVQVLADFIIEIPPDQAAELDIPVKSWIFHVAGASSNKGSEISVHLQSPTGELIEQSFRRGFAASNNEAEYKENCFADALAALGSSQRDQIRRKIPIHTVEKPSITLPEGKDVLAISSNTAEIIPPAENGNDWRTPFLDYLDRGILPADKWESRRLKAKSSNYASIDCRLHRWTANKLLLTYVGKEEA